MKNTTKKELIESKYDEFFGNGYWEKQYKQQIVIFAMQCLDSFNSQASHETVWVWHVEHQP